MTQNNMTAYNFPSIIAQFAIKGTVAHIKPHGSGHIHDTFRMANAQPESPDYLLQRINHHIFKNVPALSENIELVTNHLQKKMEAVPGANPDQEVLTLIPSKEGKGYIQDAEGNFWRMYLFIKNTRSYDVVESVQQAYEGGKAFGKFQALLSDLNVDHLHEIIPHFHNVENRLRLFREAIGHDPKGRVEKVSAEIDFVKRREKVMGTIYRLGKQGKLPLRITHNDTKFNNVLLDEHDRAQCVIDLDTVMPGFVAYDFGDAIRTIVNHAPEDEEDLERISVDMALFNGFTKGFLEETGSFLTDEEVNSLSHGVLLLPFIMGLRFLTDYIDGDNYYKINFADHNIRRARAQFRLVEKLETQFTLIQDIIQNIAKSRNEIAAD